MTKIRDLVKTLRMEYRTEFVIADLGKTGKLNRFSEESKKTIHKIGKDKMVSIGKGFQENIVLIMCQVLVRRTVILHLRSMFSVFNGSEAQEKESIRNLVNSVLHRVKKIIGEVQSTDDPKNYMIISKRMSQRDTRRVTKNCNVI